MKNLNSVFLVAILGALVLPIQGADPEPKKPAPPTSSATALEATPLSVAKAAHNSGFYSNGDRMYLLHNGRSFPVTTQYILRVDKHGITGFDGRSVPLLEGYMLSASGQIVPLPKNIKGLPAPAKAPPAPVPPADADEVPSN